MRDWLLVTLLVSCGLWMTETATPQAAQTPEEEAVIYDLSHPDPKRRKKAAVTAGEDRIREAVPGLIALSSDRDASIRLEVARALERLRDPRGLDTLAELTADKSRPVRAKAMDAMVATYVTVDEGFVEDIRRVASFVNPFDDDFNPLRVDSPSQVKPGSVQAVADLLGDRNADIRSQAAFTLGVFTHPAALPAIQSRLENETSDKVMVELIRAVYKIGEREAGEALLPLIHHRKKRVHDEAIFALGRLRFEGAAEPLKKLYEQGVDERRKIFGIVPVSRPDDLERKLFQAMAFLGHVSCESIFLAALDSEAAYYRRYGVEGLGRLGDAVHLPRLGEIFMSEKSEPVRLALSFALYNLGEDTQLWRLVQEVEKKQAFNYLLELPITDIPKLYQYLDPQGHPQRTAHLVEIVGLRGDSNAVTEIETLSKSEVGTVAVQANRAIRRLRARHSTG